MRSISRAFREAFANNQGDVLGFADIVLSSGQTLSLSNSQIWGNGISTEDAVSDDDAFTAIGSVIIGSASLTINNIYEDYSDYDFVNAKVTLYIGMDLTDEDPPRLEKIKMGTYTVDSASYNGATITLDLLDNMEQFDRAYNTTLAYPATLAAIVLDACTKCGVTLNTYTFPHSTYVVQDKPSGESTTYRDVIGWAAAIAGCFARCDVNGRLELKWFNFDVLDGLDGLDGGYFDENSPYYRSGDTADGGTFNPWSTGYAYDAGSFTDARNYCYIYSLYSQEVSVDDVIITGVRILVKDEDEEADSKVKEYLVGTNDYVIEVSDRNEFITTDTAQTVASWLGTQLIGLRFRKVNVTHLSNPTIEAGDMGIVVDRKGHEYPIPVTRTNFQIGGEQRTVCGASTPSRNSATRYTALTKSYVESRKLLDKEKTLREQQLEALAERLAAASGLYSTVEPQTGGGNIYYLHDHPTLAESSIVWKMTKEAWGVTTNYDGDHPERTVWNGGMTVDGDTIVRILTATGINADWIDSGAIVIRDANDNETFYADTATGVVRIKANTFSLSGDTIDQIARTATAGIQFASCSTAASIVGKSTGSTPANFSLVSGAKVTVLFSFANTASNPTLNVNYTGAKPIYCRNSNGSITAITSKDYWSDGALVDFVYNGSQWVMQSDSQTELFNRLTNGLTDQGIYLSNGQLFINASKINTGTLSANYIQGGILKIGGSNNTSGVIEIYNSSGTRIGRWDNGALYIGNIASSVSSPNIKIDTLGAMTAKSLTADSYIRIDGGPTSYLMLKGGGVNSNFYSEISDGGIHTYANNLNKYVHIYIGRIKESNVVGGLCISTSSSTSSYGPKVEIDQDEIRIDSSSRNMFSADGYGSGYFYGGLVVHGNFEVDGTKDRKVETKDYGERLLYCYETSSPLFGDVGEGVIGDDGRCYVQIDSIFAETVSLDQYQVFLQKYGNGDCWVSDRNGAYFIVEGTPGLSFGWEIKAKQSDFDQLRLVKREGNDQKANKDHDYGSDLLNHIDEINRGRESVIK